MDRGRAVTASAASAADAASAANGQSPASAAAGGTVPAAGAAGPAGVDGPDDLLELKDITVRYKMRSGAFSRASADMVAADGVSLSIRRGESLGLVGGTGSGKSTIAQVVMGMIEPTSGSLRIAGTELVGAGAAGRKGGRNAKRPADIRRLVQVVLQDPYSSLDPRMRVGDIIAEPLTLGRPGLRRAGRTEVKERVAELLSLVGLPAAKAELYPHQFSGGQRQRIAVARALAPRPSLIVLDEPTSALDVSVRAQILNLLKDLQARLDVTYLVISHDLVTVAYLASTVAVMHLGRIVEIGPTRAAYRAPRHPYTLELLSSVPGVTGDFLTQPRPETRSAAALPECACRFAHRCAVRVGLGEPARCMEEDPVLTPVGEGHEAACHFPGEVAELARKFDPV
jgi:oligopeptide/dipeptide ABC transporter ATP-binding protein